MESNHALAAGALAQLAADARNGTGPDARLYGYLHALGVTQADAEAAVKRIGQTITDEAAALLGKPRMSQSMQTMTAQGSDEWYTPAWVLELVRECLGGIELDPASNDAANKTVQAERFFALKDDGYMQPWQAKSVWLNPPFSETARWYRRLAAAYRDGTVGAALFLCNSAPGYNWYEEMVDQWPAIQFRRRMAFVPGGGQQPAHPKAQAKKSQTVVYFGPDVARFDAVFAPHGRRLAVAVVETERTLWEAA